MKRNILKVIVSITMCICMLLTSLLYVSAEEIIIIEDPSTLRGKGYSNHIEYTSINNVSGRSEANCVHNSSNAVYIFAHLRSGSYNGNSYRTELNVYLISSFTGRTDYVSDSSYSSMEWNESISFERGYDAEIRIEEAAGLAADSWESLYTYRWLHKAALNGYTIKSGTYVQY